MASRTGTPAVPTLTAVTDDNSRGGLFVQSNVSNEVSSFVVPTVTVNDSTIRIEIGAESA